VHEDLREFSGCYDELWDEIDGIISVTTKLGGRSLITTEFSKELGKVQTGTIAAVIVIPIHMENLLALHRK
jgi:hypothetical protein